MASTTDYTKFSFLIDNRQTARNHINKLKDAIQRNPAILEVQPILVNEKMEIIDGQHRFQAASELGLPIHYNKVKGLNIDTAREMNVLQRKWGVDDYAISYAKAGNLNYQAFNEYRREYPGISATVVMIVMAGELSDLSGDFRSGKFVMKRDANDVNWILEKIVEVREATGNEIPIAKSFAIAFMTALDNEEFDCDEFMRNLHRKPEAFHRTQIVRDALRMIEDIYNYKKSANTIRLY